MPPVVPHPWTGNADGSTSVGQGLSEALNVSFYYDGELRRRPGLGTKYALLASRLGGLEHPTAGSFLLMSTSSSVVGFNLSPLASTTLYNPTYFGDGTVTTRGMFAYHNGAAYFLNGYVPQQVIRRGDVASTAAGITGPAAAPAAAATAAGSVTAGTHLVRYRYKNSQTGYVSNASASLSVVAAGATNLPFTTVASTDAKVDQIVMEMTAASGSTFYVAKTAANGVAVTIDMSDATLAQQVGASFTDGDQLGSGHEPPPLSQLLIEHRARLFAWGSILLTFTCGVTNASPTVTGTNFSTQWAGYLISVGTDTVTYTISSVNAAGTVITLATNYAGGTNAAASVKIFSQYPDMLFWSRAGFPESWKPASWARRVFQGAGDTPSAMASMYGDLYLIGLRGMRRFVYTDDPATAMLVTIPTELGAWNQQCVVNANGRLFGWGRSGAWEITGLQPKHISRDIDTTVKALYDITYATSFFGFYDPQEKTVTWVYNRPGDQFARDALCYDLQREEWSPRKYRNGLICAHTYGDSTRDVSVYLSDLEAQRVFRLEQSRLFDGVPSTLSTGAVTVTAGSTTTVINVSETMPTGATSNLIGCYLSNFTTGEDKLISANTANTITTAAFASAPSAGTVLYLGSILCRLTSNWWPGMDLSYRERPAYFLCEQANADAVTVSVRIFKDFSATAETVTTFGSTYDPPPNGVTFTNNGTTMTGDLSYIGTYFPTISDWSKCLRFEMTQQIPFGTLQILDARFEYKDASEQPKAVVP